MKTYERLREYVNKTGIKHYVLAERCGYSAKTFSFMINGKKPIYDTDIIKLCGVLGITADKLLGIDETA